MVMGGTSPQDLVRAVEKAGCNTQAIGDDAKRTSAPAESHYSRYDEHFPLAKTVVAAFAGDRRIPVMSGMLDDSTSMVTAGNHSCNGGLSA